MRREIDDPSKAAAATFNMTPMIDVVFQLIVVFLCSMRFRTLDQKIEAQLPEVGQWPDPRPPEVHPMLRVRLQRAGDPGPTLLVVQGERLGATADGSPAWERLRATATAMRAKAPDLTAEIDAAPLVDHGEVVHALDTLVAAGLANVRFRGTKPPPGR